MNHTEQLICDYLKSHGNEALDVNCMSAIGANPQSFDKALDSLERNNVIAVEDSEYIHRLITLL
ncbi:hypothetical protein [uncultured Pseudoramibacter sp.]|uniref:hypothetical protein n=1 Tax=uncultured Pseudoramibacter sp. TaxID=1623493 RepID=UPI0025EE54D7|nr:hypothetical protein [uncultured Pseudoramibacter sp.]